MNTGHEIRERIREYIRQVGEVPSQIDVTYDELAQLWAQGLLTWEIVTLGSAKLHYYENIQLNPVPK